MSGPSSDNHASSAAPHIRVPTLEELERMQAEEDAEAPELFFEPKRRKFGELDESEEHRGAFNSEPTSNAPSVMQPSPADPNSASSPPSMLFKSSSSGTRAIVARERQQYVPGQIATGSAVDTSYLLVHERQKGNPAVTSIRHVKWQYTPDIIPDFVFGEHQCGLFLSMQYHQKFSSYILNRIEAIPGHFIVRLLLVLVDLDDHEQVLLQLNQLSVVRDLILILAFSNEEAARYLETYKSHEHSNADTLKETATKGDFFELTQIALGVVKSISSTDIANLLNTFGTVAKVMSASLEQLATVPGLGEKKILALYSAFRGPFLASSAQMPTSTSPTSKIQGQPMISSIFKQRSRGLSFESDSSAPPPEDDI